MADLIPVQFGLAEGLDADLLKGDNDESDEHVEEDECHDAHVEEEEDGGVGRGFGSRANWLIAALEQPRVVSIVHHPA